MGRLSSSVPLRCKPMSSSVISLVSLVYLLRTVGLWVDFCVGLWTSWFCCRLVVVPLWFFICGFCLLRIWVASAHFLLITRCSVVRWVVWALVRSAVRKLGRFTSNLGYFRSHIRIVLPHRLLLSSDVFSWRLSKILWSVVCGSS